MFPIQSVKGLSEWLKKQNPGQRYNYADGGSCLLFQYFKASGAQIAIMGADVWRDYKGTEHSLSPELNRIAHAVPHTFGAAAERAEQSLADRVLRQRWIVAKQASRVSELA